MLKVAGMVNRMGHYRGVGQFGLSDDLVGCPTCGPAVQCWSNQGDMIACGQAYSSSGDSCADSDGNWVSCPGDGAGYSPSETATTDNGNPNFWVDLLRAGGTIAAQVIQATSTQYRTPYGSYNYGTGPYSALNQNTAQQYLASRSSSFGGMSTTTMLLIGGGLLLALMMMKR